MFVSNSLPLQTFVSIDKKSSKMSRPKRLYPLGKYRLRVPKNPDRNKAYTVVLEYTWNRQIHRRTTNILVKIADWNQSLHQGRGGVRQTYGSEAKRINALLLARVDKIDAMLAEYQEKHPNQITADVITGFLEDKPTAIREDKGKDFVDFVIERIASDYSRNRIGRSRYENGKSGMNIFQTFLRATKRGTYKPDGIYVGEISVELIDEYITWRREVKLNGDATINHALTPILKACSYAAELKMIDSAVNARIQDMRVVPKVSRALDESEFDGKSLSADEISKLIEYHKSCQEPRRKQYIVMIKTNKRHVIPLSDTAISILKQWEERRKGNKYVFDLVKDTLDVNDEEKLYKARNSATKCINQSLVVVGEAIGLGFNLTMHVARHTFAVFALNKGLSMSVVSRLLGHGSTDVTEKVYARFLPETLSTELNRLDSDLSVFHF